MNRIAKGNNRLVALDVFRGLTIMLMLLVNNPGSWSHIYPPFRHAPWHGCTLTDLVFPFFLFIVGVSMGFSVDKLPTLSSKSFLLKSIKRGLILILIGYLMRLFPFTNIDIEHTRIMGVLQRIGLAYIFTAIIINYLKTKQIIYLSIFILFTYWLVLYLSSSSPYSLQDNFARTVDLFILGDNKMWHGHKIAFDPEGLLSTFPAIVTIVLGYFVALEILKKNELRILVKRIIISGIFLLILGWFWGLVFPINKALWTSSYVLLTGGWSMIVLGILLYIIDVKLLKSWTKIFIAYGRNPLFLFVLSGLTSKSLSRINWRDTNISNGMYQYIFKPYFGELNGSLAFAITHIFFIGIVAMVLYKKRIIIKV